MFVPHRKHGLLQWELYFFSSVLLSNNTVVVPQYLENEFTVVHSQILFSVCLFRFICLYPIKWEFIISLIFFPISGAAVVEMIPVLCGHVSLQVAQFFRNEAHVTVFPLLLLQDTGYSPCAGNCAEAYLQRFETPVPTVSAFCSTL
jgi:hypothetical protein